MRLLVVASPMTSLGGVYAWLDSTLPRLRARGVEVGVLWSVRVPGGRLEADWDWRFEESGSTRARTRRLRAAVAASIDEWCPDAVLSVLPQSDLACARAAAGRVPWIAMAHGRPVPAAGEAPPPKRLLWRAAMRFAWRRADTRLAVSRALAAEVAEVLGVPEPEVVHNGVPVAGPDRICRSGDGDRPPRAAVIGFLGRLTHEKAPDVFVQSAALLGCEARVYGNGPLADELAAAGLPNVTIEGWRERNSALSEIDVLVVPSRREGLGLAALEAGARGIPAVGRAIGGVPEVLGVDPVLARHCLVPSEADAAGFAAALRPLLDDPALRRDCGERLRAVVERDFDADRQADRLALALRAAVARAPGKAATKPIPHPARLMPLAPAADEANAPRATAVQELE